MKPEELADLPDFVWIRNKKGALVEVAKTDLIRMSKDSYTIMTEEKVQKEIQYIPPQSQPGQKKVYLDVEEM